MVVVVIVSMGLLITVLAVGVVKLKSAVTRDEDELDEAELNWEGAPNITINPLEVSENLKNADFISDFSANYSLPDHINTSFTHTLYNSGSGLRVVETATDYHNIPVLRVILRIINDWTIQTSDQKV